VFDLARVAIPISGTQLRADASLGHAFLSEAVRAPPVRRVALIGGESTGKTTLAAALAEQLGTVWVPEYGRELWEQRSGRLEYDDLLAIAREQVARENAAITDANGWLVCDTNPLVTKFYSEAMFGRVAPELSTLSTRRYDATLLCAPDFPFVQDGTRQDARFRTSQNDWYYRELRLAGIPFEVIGGHLDERIGRALKSLAQYAPIE
jgi:HTH-type transcriptional repressor of NAD biosynthesis genes